MSEHLALPQACRALRELGAAVTYHTLYKYARTGKVPALTIAGKHFIATADLPAIAATFPQQA
jgi:predicted site-specific integrase-resolvase